MFCFFRFFKIGFFFFFLSKSKNLKYFFLFRLTLATNESLVAHNELLEPSHSCSLVIGPIQKGLSISEEGTPKLSHSSQLSLTYDGRVVSDEDAAQFLASVNQFLSDPLSLL